MLTNQADITQMTSGFAEIIPRTTVEGTVSPLQPSDGLILEISPRLEAHLPSFSAIQTHLSCRFHLAVDVPGLRLDPVMRWIVGGHAVTKQAASSSQMGRFETEASSSR